MTLCRMHIHRRYAQILEGVQAARGILAAQEPLKAGGCTLGTSTRLLPTASNLPMRACTMRIRYSPGDGAGHRLDPRQSGAPTSRKGHLGGPLSQSTQPATPRWAASPALRCSRSGRSCRSTPRGRAGEAPQSDRHSPMHSTDLQ